MKTIRFRGEDFDGEMKLIDFYTLLKQKGDFRMAAKEFTKVPPQDFETYSSQDIEPTAQQILDGLK